MKNKYVDFVSDEHLLTCVSNLHKAYLKAKNNVTKKNFYSNKVDVIKLTFGSKFNGIEEESIIQAEILRQIDKSINNSIGTFHEQILGGVKGFEIGNSGEFDIKSIDDTLQFDIHFTPIKPNLIKPLFEKLADNANFYKNAKCYWVQFWSEESFNEIWHGELNELRFSHKRVYKISADKFYKLVTGNKDALLQLMDSLPRAVSDYCNLLNLKI